jgi:hypothetical protein
MVQYCFMAGETPEPTGERMYYDDYARKYGLEVPDEWWGATDEDHYVNDFGPPVVLADSSVDYELKRLRYPELYRGGLLSRISDKIFGESPARIQARGILAEQRALWDSVMQPTEAETGHGMELEQ